ncbi:GL25367 [Drosophila persimilis]|uniref:GL25367 n=1 Tax=Drosophila persimilis TaxID=7234 RepID=B4IRU3_DROPE|nr:GL25367 [Drosophila persimilis]
MEMKRGLNHEDGRQKMEDLRAFLEEQQAIVGEGGYCADASRQRRASLLSGCDEEDWCDGSQFLQLLASPLVSPAPSGHDSVSPTVSSDEGAEESDDEVLCTDGPRSPTAQEKARRRRQQRAEPETRSRRPLTLRDKIEAVKRIFQEAMPEEKRRIHRVRRRQAERAASTEEPGQESDEAPPPPPFRVVLPPMQPRTDEAETEGAQPQATGERATNPEAEWQRRLQQAEEEEGELWQPTPPAEDDEGPERRQPQAEEEVHEQHQQHRQQ